MFVNKHFYLLSFKVYRTVTEALFTQDVRHSVEFLNSLYHIAAYYTTVHRLFRHLLTVNYLLRLLIIKARVRTDDSSANLVLEHFCLAIHGENDRHTQFVFVRAKRAEFVAQPLGQHRNSTVHQIY